MEQKFINQKYIFSFQRNVIVFREWQYFCAKQVAIKLLSI